MSSTDKTDANKEKTPQGPFPSNKTWDYTNKIIRESLNARPDHVPEFKLTAESIELFKQGVEHDYVVTGDEINGDYCQGQGYIGIADLSTGEIHLVPTWNTK